MLNFNFLSIFSLKPEDFEILLTKFLDVFPTEPAGYMSIAEFSKIVTENAVTVVAKLYGNLSLPRSLVNEILKMFKEFYNNFCIKHIKLKLNNSQKLQNYSDIQDTLIMLDIVEKIFDNFKSEHLALKYFSDKGFLIQPLSVTINSSLQPRRHKGLNTIKIIKSKIEIVPMKSVLIKFLELPHVYHSIISFLREQEISSQFKSLLQGELWKRIRNQFAQKTVLPLVLYFDDVEINNPLGTHRGIKKLGALYYFIASIPFEYASKLENIFLAQVNKTVDHTDDEGRLQNNIIFTNVVEQLMKLECEGITINISGEKKQIYFALVSIIGDNLGLNTILGFTRGFNVGQSCRICTVDRTTSRTQVNEDIQMLRTADSYVDDVMNTSNGILEECVFNRVSTYSVIDNAILDPTHDLNEGICRYEMGLVLHLLIMKEKIFSIEILNSRLQFFGTDSSLMNAPVEISFNAVKKKFLILSAAEMSYFVHYFALIIGDLVPPTNRTWLLYISLRKIMCMIMQPIVTEDLCKKLENVISAHHKLYLALSGETLKPKHHHLLHYPRIMRRYGPLKHLATIRLEAKHKNLTTVAKSVTSRVNPAHTVAMKIQLQQCYRFTAGTGFSNVLLTGPKTLFLANDSMNVSNFETVFPECINNIVFQTPWVNINGTIYKLNMLVQTNNIIEIPMFLRIKYILLDMFDNVYFLGLQLRSIGFAEHNQAIQVEDTPIWDRISYSNLINYECYLSHILFDGTVFVASS